MKLFLLTVYWLLLVVSGQYNREERVRSRARSVPRNVKSIGKLRRAQRRDADMAEISEMFRLCQSEQWHRLERKFKARILGTHIEDVHRVKCDIYEKLRPCIEGSTQPEITWKCMRTNCGDDLTEFTQKAGRERREQRCKDVSTYDGKIRCIFEHLAVARTCAELQDACKAHPYGGLTHAVTGTELCVRVEDDPRPDHHRAENEVRSPRGKRSFLAGRERTLRRAAAVEVRLIRQQITARSNKAYWKVGSYPYPN